MRNLLIVVFAMFATSSFASTTIRLPNGTEYESRLPVVYIDFDGNVSKIKKGTYLDARLRIVGNDIYGGIGSQLYDGPISIKGRGNTTWKLPKKSYKIKLDKKTNLFGFGKSKHWVLIANYQDESLMRNKVAYDLSGMLGLVQMESTWVDVVLNGDFIGNYQMCEHIGIGSARVDIFDWDDVIGDADEGNLSWLTDDKGRNITGGYIFELSEEYDEVSKFQTATGLKVMIKTPEYLKSNDQMFSYVKSFWQSLEDAWLSFDKCDEFGRSWTEFVDVDSMVAYWLTQEIMGNIDAVYKSRHAYKDIDSPMMFGPVWDFDWSSASAMVNERAIGWLVTLDHRAANFFKYWISDTEFRLKAVEAYANARKYLHSIISSGGLLDSHHSYIAESAHQNEVRWFFKRGFEEDFSALKNFFSSRVKWLDDVLSSEENLEKSASPLYGISSQAVSGPFTGIKNAEYVGSVLKGSKLLGTIRLRVSQVRNGYCQMRGEVWDPVNFRKQSVVAKKVPVGNRPSLAISPIKSQLKCESRVLALKVSDGSFMGLMGAYGVEGARAVSNLSDGEYIFRMEEFPRSANGYQISPETLPLEARVTVKGTRWTAYNISGAPVKVLKLTGNRKVGTFNGKLKVYAVRDGRRKTFMATITGIIDKDKARGVVTIGKLGVSREVSLQLEGGF